MDIYERLQQSPFRRRFQLKAKDREHLRKRGFQLITQDARHFVVERLAPAQPKNDGKQTPMKNHPVFIAQHATATCCRKCLHKWHNIPRGHTLSEKEIEYIVTIIMEWLRRDKKKAHAE